MGLQSCRLSVKGNGCGGHGNFVHDQEGPLERFIVDNQKVYAVVFKHLKTCKDCDPAEVLTKYLERRLSMDKFEGKTSEGLVKLALRYKKQFKDRIPDELVQKFIMKCAVIGNLLNHAAHLSEDQIIESIYWMEPFYFSENSPYLWVKWEDYSLNHPHRDLFQYVVSQWMDDQRLHPDRDQLIRMAQVSSVMHI